MRMVHYFLALAVVLAPALLWTLWTGIQGSPSHVAAGLFGAAFAVGVHTLLIVFMIVTGRVLREAMQSRPLGAEFLVELNDFFAKKKAYPIAILACLAVVTAAVLGYGHRAFGLSPIVHMLLGLGAVIFNLWAIILETRALRENQFLVDRAASELDRIDREARDRGEDPLGAEEEHDPRATVRLFGALTIGAWFPLLYYLFIVEKGRLSHAELHPWLELSALGSIFGFVLWILARRELRANESVSP